jgi:hypothetical protein
VTLYRSNGDFPALKVKDYLQYSYEFFFRHRKIPEKNIFLSYM